jgi:hypothetical protein
MLTLLTDSSAAEPEKTALTWRFAERMEQAVLPAT